MHLTFIGWLHTLACVVALFIGGLLLWRAKGGAGHRRDGRRYLCAMVVVNLTALGIYRIGGLINEAFVRVPALQGKQALVGLTQGLALIVFLMLLSYLWGRTARNGAAALALAALAGTAQAGTLTLELTGVAAAKGPLVVALYDSGKTFLRKPMRTLSAAATGAAVELKLPDMAPGEYALALYQDINANGKMDTLLFGIPSEPTGTSNNAAGNFGPPTYEAARFTMPAGDKTLAIGLHK